MLWNCCCLLWHFITEQCETTHLAMECMKQLKELVLCHKEGREDVFKEWNIFDTQDTAVCQKMWDLVTFSCAWLVIFQFLHTAIDFFVRFWKQERAGSLAWKGGAHAQGPLLSWSQDCAWVKRTNLLVPFLVFFGLPPWARSQRISLWTSHSRVVNTRSKGVSLLWWTRTWRNFYGNLLFTTSQIFCALSPLGQGGKPERCFEWRITSSCCYLPRLFVPLWKNRTCVLFDGQLMSAVNHEARAHIVSSFFMLGRKVTEFVLQLAMHGWLPLGLTLSVALPEPPHGTRR